jgi:phage repressor protein C with HTH and peptisase S24 domain
MTTLAERIAELSSGMKRGWMAALARHCKINPVSVSDWVAGRTKSLDGANLLRAADFFKVNPEWLATGKGQKDIKLNLHLVVNNEAEIETDEFLIRQHHDVFGAMGTGLVLRDQPGQITGWRVTTEWLNKNIPTNTGKDNLCIVTGFGINDLQYDAVYFFRIGEEGFIKRLQRIPGDGIRAISENKAYESWTITPDMDFEIFGRVLKVWQSEEF